MLLLSPELTDLAYFSFGDLFKRINAMKNYNDVKLVNLFIAGSSEAFEVIIDRYRKKVYGYILGMVKQRAIADDIFQETFIKVIDRLKRGKYSDSGKFAAWLMRIAHNTVIDYFRTNKVNDLVSGSEYEWGILSRSAERGVSVDTLEVSEKNKSELRKHICMLSEEQREVVVLRYYMHLSFKEVAEHLDIGLNTALGRMRYALANLQKMMGVEKAKSIIDDSEIALAG